MSDLQSSIQRMLDQLDPPGLRAIREVQEKLDRLQPPGLKAMLESQRKFDALFVRPEFLKSAQLFKFHQSFLLGDHNFISKINSFTTSYERTLQFFKGLDLKVYDFSAEEDDELEVTDYDLIGGPAMESPETKIILLNEANHIQKTIDAIYKDNQQLYRIHHREFEEMMAELLRSRDFEVFLTKRTRDGGKDIIALQNLAGLPFKMLIECKKYAPTRKIGVDIIRGFSHVVNTNKANKGIIFTTSYFTADAKKEQELSMPYLLDLRDYHDVIQWVNTYVE
ncbi:MAG: hypothetical protein JWR09_2580 [Mucilaginibacter sp.]|nr:hypothetical protein [Mucilaginibacter sp.]